MRLVFGFLTTLIMAAIAIVFLFSFSPIFTLLTTFLEPGTSTLYSTSTKSIVDLALTKGWIFLVLFIVIGTIVRWGLQIFKREEMEEDDEYDYWQ